MDDLTIGLIGANSSFAGDVYLDNLILSQKDASGDFVTITATPNTDGTQAKTEATDKTLTMTDPDASNSAKALYAYLQGLTESDQVLFGHQNDVSRSVGTKDELGDVHDVTGSVSGIFGIDSLALFGSGLVVRMRHLHCRIPLTTAKGGPKRCNRYLIHPYAEFHQRKD